MPEEKLRKQGDKKSKKKCPICSKHRPLEKHLYELSVYCIYLGNTVKYKKRDVHTETIGKWLHLASLLEKVEINAWSFNCSDAFYCDAAADHLDRDSEHFTKFSTSLTRFVFVCHALEETYRFIVQKYDDLPKVKKLSDKKRLKEPSMKAAFLVDECNAQDLPKDLMHVVGSFDRGYEIYKKNFSPHMSGMENITPANFSYGLHLTRNLRNHIAHGIFPLLDNPYDSGDDSHMAEILTYLLGRACRIAALYIQMLLVRYSDGFLSDEYAQVREARGAEFKRFLRNCTSEYAKSLHSTGKFEFENWIGN
jgi:hypothetical protein